MSGAQPVVAVILARSTSARLPGKHLLRVGGKTLLEILVGRLRKARSIDQLVAAIPEGDAHRELESRFLSMGVAVWRGSESDVAGRFADAASHLGATWALRVNGDCPFQDPVLLDRGIDVARKTLSDFVSNIPGRTWPYGVSLELVRMSAYQAFRERFTKPEHVEHVTSWLYQNPDSVKTNSIEFEGDPGLRAARLVVDTKLDLDILSESVKSCGMDPVDVTTVQIAANWLAAKSNLEEIPC